MFKKLILSLCILAAFCSLSTAYAKNDPMTPPKPVDNQTLNSMVGTWKGESEMMGVKMKDTLKVTWSLNHQFLLMELQSIAANNPNNHYEGIGMFGVDSNGQVKTWWFDSWGAPSVSTGTGTAQKNQLVFNNGNAMFSEERSFQINGNEMSMHAKGTMNMDGKNNPFDQTGTYKR